MKKTVFHFKYVGAKRIALRNPFTVGSEFESGVIYKTESTEDRDRILLDSRGEFMLCDERGNPVKKAQETILNPDAATEPNEDPESVVKKGKKEDNK